MLVGITSLGFFLLKPWFSLFHCPLLLFHPLLSFFPNPHFSHLLFNAWFFTFAHPLQGVSVFLALVVTIYHTLFSILLTLGQYIQPFPPYLMPQLLFRHRSSTFLTLGYYLASTFSLLMLLSRPGLLFSREE